MKLRIRPTYGWGWFDTKGVPLDVPPPLTFDVTVTQAGDPFVSVLGQVAEPDHPLAGKWLVLTPRKKAFALGFDGSCSLFGFDDKPAVPRINEPLPSQPSFTGFAEVLEIMD